MLPYRFALLDLETSGLHIKHDKIIEIAVIILTEKGIEERWHALINPNMRISSQISQLTGIDNEMLCVAKSFEDIAYELKDKLNGCIIMAHNARFDYGFLRNAFKSMGISFHSKLCCTIKLARLLYPELGQYSLSFISQYFKLKVPKHRALADVEVLYEFLQGCISDFSLPIVLEKINSFLHKSSIPSQLITDIYSLPKGAGVYLFYSKHNALPIYIGKSVSLRQRILSHFQSDHLSSKEFKLAQQVHKVETIETEGELSALLLESKLIKERMPIYNYRLRRKKKIVGFVTQLENGYLTIQLSTENNEGAHSNLLGAFSSVKSAKEALFKLTKKHQLCHKFCGLEKTKEACFSYHLKRCKGACVCQELPEQYNLRVSKALLEFQKEGWPYPGAIAIKEGSQQLIFNNWCHLTTVRHLTEYQTKTHLGQPLQNDKDCYLILKNFLKDSERGNSIHILK